MKLVIQTQIKENYGAHDWDGQGECPQYWKFKGGNTYVVDGLSGKMINKIAQHGIPTLRGLIEHLNDGWEEYILDWEVAEDDAKVCDDWESPIVLSYVDGAWRACQITENGEYGYMRKEITRQIRSWTLLQGGEEANHVVEYVMEDGKTVPYSELSNYIEEVA
jgi:hypothetical protein